MFNDPPCKPSYSTKNVRIPCQRLLLVTNKHPQNPWRCSSLKGMSDSIYQLLRKQLYKYNKLYNSWAYICLKEFVTGQLIVSILQVLKGSIRHSMTNVWCVLMMSTNVISMHKRRHVKEKKNSNNHQILYHEDIKIHHIAEAMLSTI